MRLFFHTGCAVNASPSFAIFSSAAPGPCAELSSTSDSSITTGWEQFMSICAGHGYSHNSLPSSTPVPTARSALIHTICRCPASVATIGDVYAARSLSDFQTGAPLRRLYATILLPLVPPGVTITMSSTISGAPAIAQWMFFVSLSARIFFDHFGLPVAADRQYRSPIAPSEYTSPSRYTGGARGPGPPSTSSNDAGYENAHSSRPVSISYAVTASLSRLCSMVYGAPSPTENEASG